MSAAQDYYKQVLGMGHSPENALAYTRQHYPDFVPGVAAAVAAPVATPVAQEAVPSPNPWHKRPSRPPLPPPLRWLPLRPLRGGQRLRPMAATPLPANGTTPMMWGAVGCIVFALLLSMAGQFSHSWIIDNENEGGSFGLTTVRVDCSMAEGNSSTCQSCCGTMQSDRVHILCRRHGSSLGREPHG